MKMKIRTDEEIRLENVTNEAKDAAAFKALTTQQRFWIGKGVQYEETTELEEDRFGRVRHIRERRPIVFEGSYEATVLLGVYAVSGASIEEAILRFLDRMNDDRPSLLGLRWRPSEFPLHDFVVKRVLMFDGVTV